VPVFELEIPARPSEVAGVRRAVRAALVRYGLDGDHADVAQVLASELVMNAVVHGAPPIVVRLSVEQADTVLEVYDGSDTLPSLAETEGSSHRGLRVVSSLCTDWGAVPVDGGGKTVWCTISHRQEPGPRAEHHQPGRRADDHSV
jgi:anti-sigma regulatory factor (Ser/Thr protein kinase)